MYENYDSSSSNDIGYNIKEYNNSSNRWIECNDIISEDFDIITSRFSHATDKLAARKRQWNIILKNISISYNSVVNFLKRGKEKDTYRKIFHRHKKRNEFFVYGVKDVGDRARRLDAEREWYKREYARQIGEPKPQNEEELMKEATKGLIRQSKCIPFERICYAPQLPHVSVLEQVNWKDTPLAITCTCPADLCMCSNRKISLLPPAKIPYKRRPNFFGIRPFCRAIRIMKYPKTAGTLIPKLVEAVKKESEYYASAVGRKELTAKGPEFCMSGCLQYLVSSIAVDAALAAEIAKMQAKANVEGLGMLLEGEEDAKQSISAQVCDEFSCTVATQTENDPDTGELMMGDYSNVLYGSIDDSVMNDVEGMKLQISSYSYEPPDPCAFNMNKVLHVKEIKQHISKIKQLYSTISDARESYCYNDVSCQFKGLSFIESLGSILGKCKCKSVSSKEDKEKNEKDEEAARDIIAEEPEFVCPPILQRIVELKDEVNDLFKKYFKRVEAPHPCRRKSSVDVIGKDIKREAESKEIDKSKTQDTTIKYIDKNIDQEVTLNKAIAKNIPNKEKALREIHKKIKDEPELNELDKNIIQAKGSEVMDKTKIPETVSKVIDESIKLQTVDEVLDKNIINVTKSQEIDKMIKQDKELKDKNVLRDTVLRDTDKNVVQNIEHNSNSEIIGSTNVTKNVNSTTNMNNDKVLKSCSCLEKAAARNELYYHKAVECSVDKYRNDEKLIPSDLGHMTFITDRNKEKDSKKSIIKLRPDSEEKLNGSKNKTEENVIKDIHKSSVMKINYVKDIRSSRSKSSSVKSKRSSISKSNESSVSHPHSASNSEEFNNNGVLTMISKKVSNFGWRGWFSFISEKDMSVCDKPKRKSSMRLLEKLENRENALKKYDKIAKSLFDSPSFYTDEVVQNVESFRDLSSSQIVGKDVNKNTHIKSQESEPVMPKHYRFYY